MLLPSTRMRAVTRLTPRKMIAATTSVWSTSPTNRARRVPKPGAGGGSHSAGPRGVFGLKSPRSLWRAGVLSPSPWLGMKHRRRPSILAGSRARADASGRPVFPATDEAEPDRDAQEAEAPPQSVLQETCIAEVNQGRLVHLDLEGRRRGPRLGAEVHLQWASCPGRRRVLIGGFLQDAVDLRRRHPAHGLFLYLERQRQHLAGALPA